jgi:hypothetical protein
MGLEWHNRLRSTDGRFARRQKGLANAGEKIDQLHVRLPMELANEVRRIARARKMEISEYICEALEISTEDDAWELEHTDAQGSADDQQQSVG